jgi:hypothetical protein
MTCLKHIAENKWLLEAALLVLLQITKQPSDSYTLTAQNMESLTIWKLGKLSNLKVWQHVDCGSSYQYPML